MKKRKAARTDGQSAKRPHSNSAEIQRKIISQALARVGAQGITIIDARERLDVMHPAARVRELRARNWDIATVWTTTENAQGNKHRNARYVLMWRGVAV